VHAYPLPGNLRPLPIELRKRRAGIGYHTTSVSRSPSPVPPPRKAPVKIIRPPKEPVASTSKLKQPAAKATPQTSSQLKAKTQKSVPHKPTPLNLPTDLPKQPAPTKLLPPPPTAASPSPPSPFLPSDLYISMMSGLAMANMPQTMQAAASTDPMAAFQFAQMCFAPPSAFPLPPFPFVHPQPDPVAIQPRLHAPNLPPKPVSDPTPKSNPKLTLPSVPLSILREGSHKSTSTSAPNPSITIERDPLVVKQKQMARRNNIGWIPVPGFPDRGCFNLVPTPSYLHWSSSGEVTKPDPQRSLVMEDIPIVFRNTSFVRTWSDRFSAVAVHLNGGGKALIEFPSREVAEEAYDSPRLRDGLYKKATHVRVFWYRPQTEEGVASSSASTTDVTGEAEDVLTAVTATTAPEEPISTNIKDPTPLVKTPQLGQKVQSKGKGRGSSLPHPERDVLDLDLPARASTAPTSTSRPESPFATMRFATADREQRQRSGPVDRTANESVEGSERTPSRPPTSPSPSESPSSRNVPFPCLRSPSPEIQQEPTPTGSPPSLRYPSSTPPEMTNHNSSTFSSETSTRDNPSPTSTSGPPATGGASLEQQLRMRLLMMKQTRIANRSGERSSPASTPSTVVDPEPETLFKVPSPPPVSQTPKGIVASESLELLATSFITDTLNAARGRLPSEPEVFNTSMNARLNKKRGSSDAFGSSADIASKRQRLAQQIEESKRIMGRWIAAKTKEERNRIFALWEESNRFVSLTCVDCALILPHDLFPPLFLGPWNCSRNPQLRPFSGHVTRKSALLSTATTRTSRWTCLDRRSQCSPVEFVFCHCCLIAFLLCFPSFLIITCPCFASSFPIIICFFVCYPSTFRLIILAMVRPSPWRVPLCQLPRYFYP